MSSTAANDFHPVIRKLHSVFTLTGSERTTGWPIPRCFALLDGFAASFKPL